MKRFALLGEKLDHSLSPILHKAIYRQLEIDDASYRTVPLPTERLKSFFSGFRVGGFDGVNITIPHKADVIPLLDEIDHKAKLLNAVNCINRTSNKLTGYNTDLMGFAYSLRKNNVDIEGNNFAILGAGGSAHAVACVLAEAEAKSISIVNRSEQRAKTLRDLVAEISPQVVVSVTDEASLIEQGVDCVINATSVGMFPDVAANPVTNQALFNENMAAFDLIYNPLQTEFLKMAEQAGATTINGLQMLVAQAVYSVEIWMGGNIVAHVDMQALVRELEKSLS